MKTEFADVVFPIINFVLEQEEKVVQTYNRGNLPAPHDVARIQEQITSYIDRRASNLAGKDEWEQYTKYAIVAWIDWLMIQNPFTREHWMDLILEVHYFDLGGVAEAEYFKRCEKAKTKSYKNAVETFFLCFVLGFRGIYEDPSAAVHLPQLPSNGMQWQKQIASLVTANLSKTKVEPKPEFRFNNEPNVGKRQFSGAFIAFIACAAALAATLLVPFLMPEQ